MTSDQYQRRDWVVAIGSGSTAGFPILTAAARDAVDVQRVIAETWHIPTDQTVLLCEEQATTKNVIVALNEILIRKVQPRDRVFLYLSGHVDPDVRGITGCFVTHDYDKATHNFGLNLRSLRYAVEDSPARYVLTVIDACYAGVVAQGEKTNVPHWIYFTTGEMDTFASTKIFLTAVTSGQKAFALLNERNSHFTQILLNILERHVTAGQSLSTSAFCDQVFQQAHDAALSTPVLSGVLLGYSELIDKLPKRKENPHTRMNGCKTFSIVPPWLSDAISYVDKSNPLDCCEFVADLNYPDGTQLRIGEEITKCWRIRNSGKIPWRGRFIAMAGSSRGAGRIHGPKLFSVPAADPGDELDICIPLRMPPYPASVYAEFKMADASGQFVFPNRKGLYISVDVVE